MTYSNMEVKDEVDAQAGSVKPVLTSAQVLLPRVEDDPCGAPSWRDRHWWPVASVHELDPKRPTPVKIDGLSLVVWQQPSKTGAAAPSFDENWRVFADVCPHRLAPLSEGRIEPKTGNLQCAYHGWEFDGCGTCTTIPSADIESVGKACSLQRSKAKSYPAEVFLGIVWAWLGESAPRGHAKDVVKGTVVENEVVTGSYTRDLCYGYDSLLENLMDPAHVPFAHHGLQGVREDAMPIPMEVKVTKDGSTGKQSTVGISFVSKDQIRGVKREVEFQFLPPFLCAYRTKGGDAFQLTFVGVPVSPGVSRLILLSTANPTSKANFMQKVMGRYPVLFHLFANMFLDSDAIFVHHQERILRAKNRGIGSWKTEYFMPAKCDASISAFRRWLDREGAFCMQPDHVLPPTPDRQELLNRYKQHTQFCKHCLGTLASINVWQKRLVFFGLLALAADRLLLRRGQRAQRAAVAIQILTVPIVGMLQTVKRSFFFVDYEHYKS